MPGRFEVLGHQPLVIVDGAHNPPGADTCAQVFFDDFHPEGRRILVVGTLREPTAMLEALRADEFDVVVACTAPSPRGVPVQEVAKAAVALGCDEVLAADTVERGLRPGDAQRRRRRRHPRHRLALRRRRRPPRPRSSPRNRLTSGRGSSPTPRLGADLRQHGVRDRARKQVRCPPADVPADPFGFLARSPDDALGR